MERVKKKDLSVTELLAKKRNFTGQEN